MPHDGSSASGAARRRVAALLRLWIAEKELSRDFWFFYLTAICFGLGFSMYLFLYSLYLLDIGFAERQIGLVASAMTIGSMTGTLPMGAMAQRLGVRRVLLCGFAVTPLISALRPFAIGEHAQIALAFVTGLSLCYWAVCFSPATAALTTEKNRTFAFSLVFSTGIGMVGLGGLVGGCFPGWLQRISPTIGPADAKRTVLLLCCAIYALGMWPTGRLKLRAEMHKQSRAWRFDPFLLRFLPAIALWSLAAGAFLPFATAFLSRNVHLSLARIGVAYSASHMVQMAAILAAPVLFRRCGLVAGIVYTQAITAAALFGMTRTHGVPMVLTLYLGFSAFHWMGEPGIYSLLMSRVAESERSSASAANTFVISLCQAAASAVAGTAYVDFGYPAVLRVVAGIALIASVALWALLREGPHGDGAAVTLPAEC